MKVADIVLITNVVGFHPSKVFYIVGIIWFVVLGLTIIPPAPSIKKEREYEMERACAKTEK